MSRVAIVGAGGFVGASLIESLVLDGHNGVRAVVRAPRNLAGLCRFGAVVEHIFADARDAAALTKAFAGATTVVNVTTGAPAEITHSTRAIHSACQAANVRRLVHLSSAVVYGDVPVPLATDDAPPLSRHWMPYARAKAEAENWLRSRLAVGSLEVVVLRPGVVWGVRSPHTVEIVEALLRKSAYLVDGGQGVFNGIFIDNLIAAIRSCSNPCCGAPGYFNVADAETITWRAFYDALRDFVNCDPALLAGVSGDHFPWSLRAVVDYMQSMPGINGLYHNIKTRVPSRWKATIKSLLSAQYNYHRIAAEYVARPSVDREMWHLQRVRHKLSNSHFIETFSYYPPIAFADGITKTVDWLASLGYGRGSSRHPITAWSSVSL